MVEGGLDGLVDSWSRTAAEVEAGEATWVWEEWLNDLDAREILQDLLDAVPESRVGLGRIGDADTRFRRGTVETEECQWGDENADRNGWTRQTSWWYWRRPPTAYL